ncbi:MAG TPA: tripartite tricarboxylate transporter substrate binding protein BugD [Casimicrobiaceae bacterium]|nr:tripartite tricarboxylate transporter substrate binding protein BugD [Casimicrobiaceae bacterium]
MKTLLASLAAAAILAWICPVSAQNYPSHSITMIVPFAAGGPTDTIARIVAERMGKTLGQTVVVENVTGAAGSIGVGRVARAAPDGYTLSIGHWSTHVVNGAVYELSYDLLKDFEPVAMIATNPQLIVTKTTVPASSLTELIAWVKANQEKMSVGTAGVGSASHVGGIYFQNIIGAKLLFVPYRGTAPAMQDLIAGRTDLMLDQAANSLPWVRSGKIRAYAVTAKTRMVAAPDIPTVDEAGLPGLYISVWHAIWVPKGTPKDIVAKLNASVVETLADPMVRQRLTDLGQEIPPREQQTPEALGAYHEAEIAKWWPLIKAAGIKAE